MSNISEVNWTHYQVSCMRLDDKLDFSRSKREIVDTSEDTDDHICLVSFLPQSYYEDGWRLLFILLWRERFASQKSMACFYFYT
ncbi:hypothetical protein J6590_046241 [Homalodisca vitripennis]|nr:hypothetical protein J6590_046241 [Homalodisca vitripennis]